MNSIAMAAIFLSSQVLSQATMGCLLEVFSILSHSKHLSEIFWTNRYSVLIVNPDSVHFQWGNSYGFEHVPAEYRIGTQITQCESNIINSQFANRTIFIEDEDIIDPHFDLDHDSIKWVFPNTEHVLKELSLRKPTITSFVYLWSVSEKVIIITEAYFIEGRLITEDIESWNMTSMARMNSPQFIWKRRSNLRGTKFNVGIVEYRPYLFLPDGPTNLDAAIGFDIEVLKSLSDQLNFTYNLKVPKDGLFGSLIPAKTDNEKSTWNGLVHMLELEELDFTASMLTYTLDRASVIEFSTNVESNRPIIVSKALPAALVNSFLAVYDRHTWVSGFFTAVALITGAGAILATSKPNRSHPKFKNEVNERPFDWIYAISMTFLCQGSTFPLNTLSMRILFASGIFFGLLSYTVFGALLTSFLSVRIPIEVVDSLEAIHKGDLNVYVLGGSFFEGIFSHASPNSIAGHIWEHTLKDQYELRSPNFDTLINGFYNTEDNAVFFTNRRAFSYWVSKNKAEGCEMAPTTVSFVSVANNLGFKRGFKYKSLFDYHIHKLRESGMIDKWIKDWLDQHVLSTEYICSALVSTKDSPKGLGLNNVSLAFHVILLGIGTAILSVAMENVVKVKPQDYE